MEAFIKILFRTYLCQPKSTNKVSRFVWKLMLILERTKSFEQILWNFMLLQK